MKLILNILITTFLSLFVGFLHWFIFWLMGDGKYIWWIIAISIIVMSIGVYLISTNKKKTIGLALLIGPILHMLLWAYLLWLLSINLF